MSDKTKTKLANRTAYVILSILLVTLLTVTIIAIASTVARRNKPPLPDPNDTNNATPNDTDPNDSDPTDSDPTDTDPVDTDPDPDPQIRQFILPTAGYLSKDFSEDMAVFSQTMNDYRVHLGIDIVGKIGDPVYAFSDGVIEKIYLDPFMGKTIIVDHGDGLKSHYMNLSESIPDGIAEGTTVAAGTIIGAIGETAILECADEPHLHFEVWYNGKRTNPANYIEYDDLLEANADFED